jgi:hypothetical protein
MCSEPRSALQSTCSVTLLFFLLFLFVNLLSIYCPLLALSDTTRVSPLFLPPSINQPSIDTILTYLLPYRYCNSFIRGLSCSNPECVYLHELGSEEDRFTKAEIQAGHTKLNPVPGANQQLVTGMGGPSGTGKRPAGSPVLPAPVFLSDLPSGSSVGGASTGGSAMGMTPSEQKPGSPRTYSVLLLISCL